uniref:G protein-coupled receptor n=1 Tax=Panagrolaimus superbus TaxID=310955 RepID=A0A914Z7C0_9BILA
MFCWCYSLAGGSYAVIVWSSYAVWKHLKNNAHHMSAQMKDANHQISKTLIMQATLPVFVCLIPIAFTVTMVFLRANITGIGLICSLLFAWIPVVNTIVTISVVKGYRMTVLKFLHWPKARNQVSVASVYNKESFPSII